MTLLKITTFFAYALAAAAEGGSNAAGGKPAVASDAKPAEKAEAKPKVKKRGVGTAAKEAILKGFTNEQALAAVRKEFPDANTTKASINWYRNDARKKNEICTEGDWKGKPVPNAREMAKAAKAKAEAEAPKTGKAADPTA